MWLKFVLPIAGGALALYAVSRVLAGKKNAKETRVCRKNPLFKIQEAMPEKRGFLKKKAKMDFINVYADIGWEEGSADAVVCLYRDDDMKSLMNKISLARCTVQKVDSPSAELYCIELSLANRKELLFASSDLDREEWVDAIRKYCTQSNIENSYLKSSKLGAGSFATVFRCVERGTGKEWALKEIDKSSLAPHELDDLKSEIRISLIVGSHPHIVFMKEFIENSDRYYIVLEQLTGGELFDRIIDAPSGHFTERAAAETVRQMLGALAYLHSRSIAHRDLKPENFIYTDGSDAARLKLVDFGFACICTSPTSATGVCGSPGYVAPEILEKDAAGNLGGGRGYGVEADLWSLGVVLFVLLTGVPPFGADSDEESFALTRRGEYPTDLLKDVSTEARALVARLLVVLPAERAPAEVALRDPWLEVAAGPAGDRALRAVRDNLRALRARTRLKRAMNAAFATTRMKAILRFANAGDTVSTSDTTAE